MKYAKLVMVSGDNNNRYIEMVQADNNHFEIYTGRVDLTRISQGKKPIEQWDSYYRSKTRLSKKPYPYTDITGSDETQETTLQQIDDPPNRFLAYLQAASKNKVFDTYNVSSTGVTQQQIDHVSALLTNLADSQTVEIANNTLIQIYTYLPRKMDKVQTHLLNDLDGLQAKIEAEQDNLDALASQVVVGNQQSGTLAAAIGIEIGELSEQDKTMLNKLDGSILNGLVGGHLVSEIYKVNSLSTSERFKSELESSLLWHGSHTSNWISILRTGLKIYKRAANGRLYGNGLYFANDIRKSLQYGSTILALFEVATGRSYIGNGYNWQHGINSYDSLHVKKHPFDEIIVYNENQATVRFIVKIEK